MYTSAAFEQHISTAAATPQGIYNAKYMSAKKDHLIYTFHWGYIQL
jgi:hypothetical protein